MKAVNFICLPIVAMLASWPARADDITAMISQYRRAHGLPAVKVDPRLSAIAERQARAMAEKGIMDHNVDGSFTSRISGASLAAAAENIAAGTRTWDDTLRMWEASPGHNRNLLTPGADIVGVAVARNDDTRYKVYWAMVIGRRDTRQRAGKATAAARDAPAAESAVGEWLNDAVTSIRNLLP
jgi:hypothetical protein